MNYELSQVRDVENHAAPTCSDSHRSVVVKARCYEATALRSIAVDASTTKPIVRFWQACQHAAFLLVCLLFYEQQCGHGYLYAEYICEGWRYPIITICQLAQVCLCDNL